MSDIAIRVENLGKKYTLGGQKSGSFRESMTNLFSRNSKPKTQDPNTTDFWALKDINFEIKRGEAVGIIGRNGAGKSTLLKILSRITEPTKGRFEVFGRVSSLLEVGTGFHPELTGRENVYLNGTILGMKRAEVKAKFDEIVAFSGVEKFIDTPVKHYSSGMQVRLAFAVAAHLEPEILIIDEVLAVGDAEFQKKCLGKMEDVTGEGRTVLFVSHNMGAVRNLCQQGLLIDKGKLRANGAMNEIVDLYANELIPRGEAEFDHGSLSYYVDKVSLTNVSGKITSELKAFQEYKINLRLVVKEDVKKLTVGIGILSSEGVAVRSTWDQPKDYKVGIYEVSFVETSVFYGSGSYKIVIGLSIGTVTVQYVEDGLIFIVENFIDKSIAARADQGLILNPMKVEVHELLSQKCIK